MLPDCLPWLGVLGEWTNPLWLGVCKRLSKHLQWTQCHIERLCIRDYCRTQHFDRPDLWNMSGKIAVGGGIPKAILSRSSAALPAPFIFARSFLERVLRKFKTRLRRILPMLSTFNYQRVSGCLDCMHFGQGVIGNIANQFVLTIALMFGRFILENRLVIDCSETICRHKSARIR